MRIERGTVIADRYVVSAIEKPWLADAPDAGVVCLALDAILDVPVILYAADEDLAGDLKDAGRRLALVNDPRVPSVLDVGAAELEEDRSIVYVVCERTAATSLAEVLSAGPIGPEEARAITGEVSEVLVHAGRRGLHHRCLGPESIGIMADGDVVVHGIAIDAALSEVALGLEVQTDTTALREDALAVVDILYACLSGQWPKPESRAGLAAAPRKNQRVVAIEKIRRDLPEDLTAFLTGITSHSDPGPRSPGEIVRYLREWKRDTLADLEGSPLPDEELFTAEAPRAEDTADADDPEAAAAPTASGRATDDTVSGAIAAADADAAAEANTAEREPTSTTSTSAGAGAVGAKPTANTSPPVKKPAEAAGAASSTIGMGKTGARPTTTPARPVTPAAPPQRQATPDQIQAALARIGMTRPGTSGYSAGRSDGVATKLDDQLQMREASVFPLSADDLTSSDVEEWTPEQTYSEYEDLSAWEYDSNVTAPIVDRDALWGESEDVSTQQMPIIPDLSEDSGAADGAASANDAGHDDTDEVPGVAAETAASPAVQDDSAADDDSSWFLGGVFTTREEEVEQQRLAFERERALERRRAEAARRRVLEAEARTSRQREASKRESSNREAGQSSAASAGNGSRTKTATKPVQKESGAAKATPAGSGRGSSSTKTASAAPAAAASGVPGTNGSSAAAQRSESAAASAHAKGGGPAAASASAAGGGSSPGSGPGAGSRSAQERRRITFLVLALLLVVALVIIGIFAFGGSSDDEVQPEAEPTQEAPADEQEPSEEPEAEGPEPVVVGIEAIDPEGDDEENSDQAENVMPGVQGGWRSERYNSPAFGGLKSGLGLAIELEEESLVSQLDLLAPEGTTLLDVRVGDSDDVDDATTVASVELDGNTTVELDEPTTAQYVFIWFTEATAEGDGYRVMIDEVDIS